jgi:hypothetical protein
MRCSHSTFLVAAIPIAIIFTPAQAGQVEDFRPFDLAHLEWVASGGHGWDRIAGMVLDGTRVEGGVPSRFEETLDMGTGHSGMTQQTGPTRAMSGYDGVAWNAFNGIVNSVDLPPLSKTLDLGRLSTALAGVPRRGTRSARSSAAIALLLCITFRMEAVRSKCRSTWKITQ